MGETGAAGSCHALTGGGQGGGAAWHCAWLSGCAVAICKMVDVTFHESGACTCRTEARERGASAQQLRAVACRCLSSLLKVHVPGQVAGGNHCRAAALPRASAEKETRGISWPVTSARLRSRPARTWVG